MLLHDYNELDISKNDLQSVCDDLSGEVKYLSNKNDQKAEQIRKFRDSIQNFNRELNDWILVYDHVSNEYSYTGNRAKLPTYKPKRVLILLKSGKKVTN